MVQPPVVCDVWPEALNPVFQSFHDFQIKCGVYSCTRFYELAMNQSADVKIRDEHDFPLWFAHSGFLRARRSCRVPLRRLPFRFQIVLKYPRLVPCNDVARKLKITFVHVEVFLGTFQRGATFDGQWALLVPFFRDDIINLSFRII